MKPRTILDRQDTEQQAALLYLRLVMTSPGPVRLSSRVVDSSRLIYWLLGEVEDDIDGFEPQKQSALRYLHRTLESRFRKRPFYPASVGHVGERLGLSEAERKILWLAVLNYDSPPLHDALSTYDSDLMHMVEGGRLVAKLIDHPAVEVLTALHPDGRLISTGLMDAFGVFSGICDFLNVSHRVALALRDPDANGSLLDAFLLPARPTTLTPDDFPHLHDDLLHCCAYLKASLRSGVKGVNVLFHGIPGVGKTEFAALVAAQIGVPLYAVPDDVQKVSSMSEYSSRFTSYRMTQALLEQSPAAVILFDDIEDGILENSRRPRHLGYANFVGKASVNSLLEINPVPAIWIANTPDQLDYAHRRRFDLAIEFRPPPRSVRLTMIDKAFVDIPVSQAWKSGLSDDRHVTPAQLGKIGKVVGVIGKSEFKADFGLVNLDVLAQQVYRSSHKLRFGREPDLPEPKKSVVFDVDFLNCSLPAAEVETLFRRSGGVTACFYGIPGTGKTAFAEHLARMLDKPLLVKRASDLLRPFVGETEMRLRAMFEEARDENSVLLLDEADSFLADRDGARQSWEVTQVNELLTQIERFSGVFIATTNAFEVLDPASLRRFDVKLRFDPLTETQKVRLLEAVLPRFGMNPDVELLPCRAQVLEGLNAMPQLTAGDVAVVVKRLSASETPVGVLDLIDALRDEYRHKKHPGRSIGFVAN